MNDFSSMLRDGIDNTLSSRRVITFLAFMLCAIAFIANLFFGMKIEQFIFDSMSYIAMAGLGATVAEKFSSAERISVMSRHGQYCRNDQIQSSSIYPRRPSSKLPNQEDPLL